MDKFQTINILVAGFAAIAIYSFLIKENPVYRFFEHLYIGIAAGFLPVLAIKNFIWPKFVEPLLGLNIVTFPDGTTSGEYNYAYWLYLIPALFGLLYYTIYIKRFSWMLKLVIGFSLGASAGMAFKGFFPDIMPQVFSSFKSLIVFDENLIDWKQSFQNTFFIFTLVSVMFYFFFTFRRDSTRGKMIASSGRWLMMICFGAFFGSTVMARMSLLVERLQFLIHDWFGTIVTLLG